MMLLLFGPPGVGKGTQADLLQKQYHLLKFSMGDILREEVARQSELGLEAEGYMKQGKLVPDKLILEIAEDYIKKHRSENLLFDGFPRNLAQAAALEKKMQALGLQLDLAIELVIAQETIIQRLALRRYCSRCGAIYNLQSAPPRQPGICDHCAGTLLQRPDDNEETIRRRLQTYETETRPLAEFYQARNCYCRVDASGNPQQVYQNLIQCLNAHH